MNFLQTLEENLKPKDPGFIGPVKPFIKTLTDNLLPQKDPTPLMSTISNTLNQSVPPKPKGVIRSFLETAPSAVKNKASEAWQKELAEPDLGLKEEFKKTFIKRPAKILKFLAQGTAESLSSVGKTVLEAVYAPIIGKDAVRKQLSPDDPFNKKVNEVFFGKPESPKTYFQIKEDIDEFAQESPVATPWEKKNLGLMVAVMGFTTDVWWGGGAKKKVTTDLIKTIAKETEEKFIKEAIIKAGLPEEVFKTAMPRLVAADSPEAVRKILLEEGEKFAQGLADQATKTGPKEVAEASRDEVASGLSNIVNKSDSFVNSEGKVNLDNFGEAQELMTKIEKGTDTAEDLTRAREILKLTETSETKKAQAVAKERKYITSTQASEDIASDVSREISDKYNPKSNKELVEKSVQRVDEDFEAAKKFARENSTDEAVATRVAVDKELSARYAKASTEAEKQSIAKELSESIITHARLATEEGRAVQANALLGKQTPEGMLRTTSRMIDSYNKTHGTNIPQIGQDVVEKVLKSTDEIAKMPEGLPKEVAKKKLVDELESKIPSPVWKKIVNVWKAGLLTGVKTSGVNIQSNFWNGAMEVIKDIPATGIDMAASLFTGERTKAFTLRGLGSGAMDGVKKGWNYLRTGVSEQNAASALEFNKVHFDSKPGKVLQAYADDVYRIIGAEDMPFYYGAMKRSLAEQAIVTAKNEGKVFKNAAEKTKYIQDFIDNPSEEAVALAGMDASIATFRNDTALGHMAQSIQNAPVLGPAAQMTVLPFAKNPSAVATALFNYSPAGTVSTFYKTFKGGGFNQKEFAEGLGRVVTGFGGLWLGTKLYEDGLLSLGYPKDEKERAKWEATGQVPNSVKIGDVWYPLIQFGPMGSVIGVGGYYQQGKEETGSVAGGATQGLFGGAKGLTEQTFLTGVKSLIDVIDDPENKATLYSGRVLASIVPTIVSDFAQSMDDYQRKSSDFLDPLKARIPEIRKDLNRKLDVWGQPLERNRSALATALSPARLSNTIQNSLNTEVERLAMAGEDIRPTKLDPKIGSVKLDDNEYYLLQRMYGDVLGFGLESMMKNPEYQALPPDEQAKLFKQGIKDIKKGVGEVMLPVLIQKRYDLPDTVDPKLATQLVEQLSKVSEEFNKSSTSKQRKLILNLLKVED